MKFDTPLALFQHLLTLDEQTMAENLPTLIDESHEFYSEVLALISAHEKNQKQTSFSGLINQQADKLVEDNTIHELMNSQIGVYKLTKKLGQGGMGAVYLGERNDGQLKQKVAIKFVYPSIVAIAGDDFLQKEAQHLANLRHANIAKVNTIGKTKDHLPYMVMEYIDGVPIDQYCDDNKLDTKSRLELFKKVCNAIQYAHQNMVVHADIKPTNLLVDRQGEPKLVDFGIAKTVNSSNVSESEKLSAFSRDFASPESVAGAPVSVTCDIYSIGKVIAKACFMDKALQKVVNKCCSIDPNNRYESVSILKDDLNRKCVGSVLSVENQSTLYSVYRFLSRHYIASVVSALFICAISITSYKTINESRLKEIALHESATIEQVMLKLFDNANPDKGKTSLESVLQNASNQIIASDKLAFERKNNLILKLAESLRGNMHYSLSVELLDKIVENYEVTRAEKDKFYYETLVTKAISMRRLHKYKEVKELYLTIEKNSKDIFGANSSDWASVLGNMAINYQTLKNFELALSYTLQATEIDRKIFGENHDKLSLRYNSLSRIYSHLLDYENALIAANRALEIRQSLFPETHPKIAILYRTLGRIYLLKHDFINAANYFSAAEKINETHYPENNAHRLFNREMLLLSLVMEKNTSDAMLVMRDLEYLVEKYKLDHSQLLFVLNFSELAINYTNNGESIAQSDTSSLLENYKSIKGAEDFRYIVVSSAISI